ncbi:uncharacterized protein LOC132803567 [Ziziphus jujuba]|uniref:Uncharacterized protein LOC132803567 n=1 Tax=Ziziphus jujuba TaxID=326968 RepID=A0ABM4A7R6_ZIZJJ|nr:uncharacterized protein LOC132803567 [Ziziphus jujuba]
MSDLKSAFITQKPIFLMLYKDENLDTNNTLPSAMEYEDIFPEEVPSGLPPLRGIEHQIDFIPGVTIPNCPTYRTNPEEAKELQKQVEELLAKGYIRESMSPCAVQERWNLENVHGLQSHQQNYGKVSSSYP